MKTQKINIKTPDGNCDSFIASPGDSELFPAILLFMDAFGPRPSLYSMAEKLASYGYFVLLPNLFYRARPAPVVDLKFPLKAEEMPEAIKQITPLIQKFTPAKTLDDVGVFLDFLSQQKQVRQGKVGITGYCLGGSLALRTAARYPEHIAAAAIFHGGNLATETPESPHRLLAQVRAELYIANADNDKSMPAEQIERLRTELERTGLRYEMETYAGAAHGFSMVDLPAFNEAALNRHWTKLIEFFDRQVSLKRNVIRKIK